MQLPGGAYTVQGYAPGILYDKVRLFDAVQKVWHNAAAISDTISLYMP